MSNLSRISDHERFQPKDAPAPSRKGGQLEETFTRTANTLVEAFAKAPLTSREARIIRAVERATFGWQKSSAWLAASVLSEMTGMPAGKCSEALNSLIRKRVLIRQGGGRSPVRINKQVDQWDFSSHNARPAPENKANPTWGDLPQDGVTDLPQNGVTELPQDGVTYKERKETKEIKTLNPLSDQSDGMDQNELEILFDRFWQAGLRKDGKKPAREKFSRLLAKQEDPEAFTDKLVSDIATRLDAAVQGFDRLHPKTYLNQQRWEDDQPEVCPHAAIIEAWNAELPNHIEKVSPEDWTPESNGFQALAGAWENFKTRPRASTGKPVFSEQADGVRFYREVFRKLASHERIHREDAARWCRLSWAVRQQETVRIFKGELA